MARVVPAGARIYPNPIPFVRAAAVGWSKAGLKIVVEEVRINLSGKVLESRTGKLLKSIPRNSKLITDGFEVGTNVGYGVAWESGFERKSYTIIPKSKRALAFTTKSGDRIIRKKVTVPAGTFAARPFIVPAVRTSIPALNLSLNVLLKRMYGLSFPPVTVTVNFMVKQV